SSDLDRWADEFVPALRAMCVDQGFVAVDGFAALGDFVTNEWGHGADGVHLTAAGAGVLDDTILDALASRTVVEPARLTALEATVDGLDLGDIVARTTRIRLSDDSHGGPTDAPPSAGLDTA